MTKEKRSCFISTDFECIDFEYDNIERYDFTKTDLDPTDYDFKEFRQWCVDGGLWENMDEEDQEKYAHMSVEELSNCLDMEYQDYLNEFNSWAQDNLTYEELYQVPMMTTLYYYPTFVDFMEEDRGKASDSTTLLYDTELGRWAVGMTGGGMDLLPQLLDTFINLDSCVPENIACAVSKDYSAYVDKEKHKENIALVAEGLEDFAEVYRERVNRLK